MSEQTIKRRRKKKRRDLMIFAVVILFVIAMGAILPLTVFFNISSIEIGESAYYSKEIISEAAGIELQSNIFRMKARDIEEELERRLPYIGEAQVKRSLPETVRIIISDTAPALAIEDGAGYTLLDMSGKILENGCTSLPGGTAIVKGFYINELVPGDNISDYEAPSVEAETAAGRENGAANAETLSLLKELAQAVEIAELEDISVYDISDISDIRLIYQDRLTLMIGGISSIDNKLRLGKEAIIRENEKNPLRIGIVEFLSADKASVRSEAYETLPTDDIEE